ncbi:MAG: hypothetical protein OHK0038_01410 [Flammeovirgaceae bacterium]
MQATQSVTQTTNTMKDDLERFSVKSFKEQLSGHRISLAFHGMFSQDVLSLIGLSLKNTPDSQVLSKRLFGIVIEMAQNIHHYSAEKVWSEKDQRKIGIGVITISENDEYYIVSSGNYADIKDVPNIVERSNYINKLSPDELRDYYRDQRKAPQREGKPGANLGFIDMVRKSGNPIDVIIKDYNDAMSFFILTVKINKKKD